MSAETLRKAAEIVRERGLAKGFFVTSSGSVCAEGAIVLALGGTGSPLRLRGAALGEFCASVNALKPVIGGAPLTWWNDSRHRTADEVITAFEMAATNLEAP